MTFDIKDHMTWPASYLIGRVRAEVCVPSSCDSVCQSFTCVLGLAAEKVDKNITMLRVLICHPSQTCMESQRLTGEVLVGGFKAGVFEL